MSGSEKIRLIKIASEINIGKETIVEFLHSKGFTIENKPTSTLTEEMVDVVYDKFKREKKAAEKQREKILKHKEIRRTPDGKGKQGERPGADDASHIAEDFVHAEEPAMNHDQSNDRIPQAEKPIERVEPATVEVKEVKPEPVAVSNEIKEVFVDTPVKQHHVEDKNVNIETGFKKSEEISTSHQTVTVAPTQPEPERPVVQPKPETREVEEKINEKVEAVTPAVKTEIVEDADYDSHDDSSIDDHDDNSDSSVDGDPNSEESKESRRKKKKKKLIEVAPGEPIQLKGLTIVGKIDLAAEKAKQQEKAKQLHRKKKNNNNFENRGNNPNSQNSNRGEGYSSGGYNSNRGENSGRSGNPNSQRNEGGYNRGENSNRGGDNQNRGENQQRSEHPRRSGNPNAPRTEGGYNSNRGDNAGRGGDNQNRGEGGGYNSGRSEGGYNRGENSNRGGDNSQRPNNQNRNNADNNSGDQRFQKKKPTDQPQKRSGAIGGAPALVPSAKPQGEAENSDDKNKFKTVDKKEDKKKKKRKKTIREQISQEEVDRAIRQTLAGMEYHGSSMRAKLRQKKKAEREEKEQRFLEEQERDSRVLRLTEFVTTSDLANLMGISANEIILKCMQLGLMVTINQRLDKDTIILIADDYDYEIEFQDQQKMLEEQEDDVEDERMESRPPIVTIMGHVDHGKTSLLDYIRKANVVSGEAGGITQHIGAYSVLMPGDRHITFLDTPGHEAFTAMRARGAQATDIVVLVVSADDSVMPQTIEAISHAKAANVPIIVAINKIDKPDANPDRIRQQLTDYGVLVEEWGGKNQCVEISAKKGINIDLLLEKILLESDVLDLQANPYRKARGVVIESNMSKGLGPVATIIVQKGTLRIGDPFVAGIHSGKVRAMFDEKGHKLEEVLPAFPVRVIGFDGLPEAGDSFIATDTDVESRNISNERKQLRREQDLRQVRHVTLDEISAQILIGGVQDLNLVIKGDVGGSVEAISDSLLKLSRDEVRVNILHKGVGAISESDVMLAAASGAVVIGFNVSPTVSARKIAETEKVDIRFYDIIYDCINEIQMALEGLLKPELKEEVTSEVEVRRIFKISRLGSIAGCYVLSGKIIRSDKVRLLRNGLPIFTGGISSLKRGKDDVREVDTQYECGIQLDGYNDLQEGDIIQGYKIVEVKRSFS